MNQVHIGWVSRKIASLQLLCRYHHHHYHHHDYHSHPDNNTPHSRLKIHRTLRSQDQVVITISYTMQWIFITIQSCYNVSNPTSPNVSQYLTMSPDILQCLTMSHNASLGGGASIALSSQEPPLQPLYPVHQGI